MILPKVNLIRFLSEVRVIKEEEEYNFSSGFVTPPKPPLLGSTPLVIAAQVENSTKNRKSRKVAAFHPNLAKHASSLFVS